MRGTALVLAAFVLAGCSSSGPGPVLPAACEQDPIGHAPAGEVHEHLDLSHHALACGIELVGHLPLIDEPGEFAGAHSVILHGTLAAVSVRSGDAGHGFDLIDVGDPAHPTVLGQYRSEQSRGGDRNIAFSADGSVVFMGVEGDEPDRAGVRAIDVSDPANPTEVAYHPLVPFGVHTLEAFEWQGSQYVAAINFGFNLLEYTSGPLGPMFLPVSRFTAATAERIASHPSLSQTTVSRDVYGHDTFIAVDEPTGALYLTFAGVYEGTYVFDISDPRVPREVARWIPPGPEQPTVSHYAQLYYPGDGRRILITGEENFEGRHEDDASRIWFTDLTDPASPRLLSTWTNPAGHPADRILLSVHYFEAVDGRLYLAHYHAGLWVLDIRDPAEPKVEGYYMPHEDTQYVPDESCCIGYNMEGVPMVFDVTAQDGLIALADFATGVYFVRLADPA